MWDAIECAPIVLQALIPSLMWGKRVIGGGALLENISWYWRIKGIRSKKYEVLLKSTSEISRAVDRTWTSRDVRRDIAKESTRRENGRTGWRETLNCERENRSEGRGKKKSNGVSESTGWIGESEGKGKEGEGRGGETRKRANGRRTNEIKRTGEDHRRQYAEEVRRNFEFTKFE